MKGKAVISKNIGAKVCDALSSPEFAKDIIIGVMQNLLGAKNPLERPAEYYIQEPDFTIQANKNFHGVEFRLTGCTRNGRTPAQFHNALVTMHSLVKKAVYSALSGAEKVQLFVVIMLDSDIETFPGSHVYSNIIESEAEWILAE